MMRFHCVACGEIAGDAYQAFCKCGSMIDVEYDSARVRLADSANPYVRFRDLLPLADTRDRLPSDARYSPAIHAKALGARFGLPKLYLKDETVLPTRSTKDRMAAVALGFLWERGVRSFCTSSTGNSSTSYASAIRAFPDMTLHLFTAEDFVERVQHADHPQVQHFGMRDASFVDAFNHAATYAAQHKLVSERGFFNLGRREGLKMAYFEAYGSLAGVTGIPVLEKMLLGKGGLLSRKEDPETRACAAMALGRIRSPEARAILDKAAQDKEPLVRNAVSRALREVGM